MAKVAEKLCKEMKILQGVIRFTFSSKMDIKIAPYTYLLNEFEAPDSCDILEKLCDEQPEKPILLIIDQVELGEGFGRKLELFFHQLGVFSINFGKIVVVAICSKSSVAETLVVTIHIYLLITY